MNLKLEYRGLYVEKCNFERNHGEFADKLVIAIKNLNVTTNKEPITEITYSIKPTYSFGEGEIVISAGFMFDDTEFIDEIKQKAALREKEDSIELSDITSQKILAMISISFPYVRQAVENITRDLGGSILIPIIYPGSLMNNKEIVFNKIEENTEEH